VQPEISIAQQINEDASQRRLIILGASRMTATPPDSNPICPMEIGQISVPLKVNSQNCLEDSSVDVDRTMKDIRVASDTVQLGPAEEKRNNANTHRNLA